MDQNKTISVLGNKFVYRIERLPINKLKFFSRNPRIQWLLEMQHNLSNYSEQMKQETMYSLLQEEESVEKLESEILRDTGVQEPIIVRSDTLTVIEGNSRLAVYRNFNKRFPNDPEWESILCALIEDLSSEEEDRIVAQAHLQGRTAWSKGAQAYYYRLRRRFDPNDQTKIANHTEQNIGKKVKAMDLMRKNQDRNPNNFEKYQVLVSMKKYREVVKNRDFHQTLLKQIKDSDGFDADALKKMLPTIQKDPGAVERYVNLSHDLRAAFEFAKLNRVLKNLENASNLMRQISEDDINNLGFERCERALDLLEQISQETSRLQRCLEDRFRYRI